VANTAKRGCFILLYYVPSSSDVRPKRGRESTGQRPTACRLHEHDHLRHGKLATRRPTRRGDSDRFISPTLLLLACYNRISSRGAQVVEETTTLPCAATQQMAQRRRRGVILVDETNKRPTAFISMSDGLFIPSDNIRRVCLTKGQFFHRKLYSFLHITGPTYHIYTKKFPI
jgi:hypothetical protein